VKWVSDPGAEAAGYGRDQPPSYEYAFKWADKHY